MTTMRLYRLTRRNDGVNLTIGEAPVPAPGPQEVRLRIEAASLNYRDLIVLDGASRSGLDGRIPLIEANFPFMRPPHGSVYSLLFPGPVHFAQERACMRFAAQYLTLPPRRDERALRTMLQHALPLFQQSLLEVAELLLPHRLGLLHGW